MKRESLASVTESRNYHRKQHEILDLALNATLADEWKSAGRASDESGQYHVKFAYADRAFGGLVLITYHSTTCEQSDSHQVYYLEQEYENAKQRMGISSYYCTLGHLIERAYVMARKSTMEVR